MKYFLVKVKFEGLNDKGKVVKISEQYLVESEDVKSAEQNFRKESKEFMCDFEISSISETKIIDVFKYEN